MLQAPPPKRFGMDQLLALIGALYDAALDPTLWDGVLGQLNAYFDTIQTLLVTENTLDPASSRFYASVEWKAWAPRYVESFMLINPTRLAMAYRVKAGDTIITTDFMTPEEYSATRFSREFLAERGIVDIAVAILEQTATCFTVLSAQRNSEQGFADETLRRKLQLVMPHAQRALKIARLFEHQKMVASTLADTLDQLVAAVFLLTSAGAILHSNARGSELLGGTDVARSVNGRLVLSDKAAAAALAHGLARAAQGEAALGAKGRAIAVRTPSDRKFVATIMPLSAGRRRVMGSPNEAVAAVCLKEAEFEEAQGAQALALLHGLTRREMAILAASVEVGGVTEVAGVLGIAEGTVRSHLKAIFGKTGATRQADLVKLMAGVASPFGPAVGS